MVPQLRHSARDPPRPWASVWTSCFPKCGAGSLRIEWLAGAEEDHRRVTGRPMMAAELEQVLLRYPGDL